MIKGHGIDIQEISAIEALLQKKSTFAEKVLTPLELERFSSLTGRRRGEFLAGRWAAKEAFAKALGTGIGKIGFLDMEILPDCKGRPVVTKSPCDDKVWLSISHSGNFVQASVILEEKDET